MKNLTVFRSPNGWEPELDKLRNNLSIPGKMGYQWKIVRNNDPFLTIGDNIILVCEKKEKLLPSSVINRELKLRADDISESQGYKPGKKQIMILKEQIISEFSMKAFEKVKTVKVWIDTLSGLLCIDTASESIADDIYSRLSRDMDYRGHRLLTEESPETFMRKLILSDDSTVGEFFLGHSCVLQDMQSGGKRITYKNESLDTEAVCDYIRQGRAPFKLEMLFRNSCSFMIDRRLAISKIVLPDLIQDDSEFESADDYSDSEFTLRAGECRKLLSALLEELKERNQGNY